MTPRLRRLFVGRDPTAARWHALLAVLLGVAVTVAYELVLYRTLGGVVFVPAHAVLAAFGFAAVVAYRNEGLLVCWLGGAAAGVGFDAFHYVLGITHRPLVERLGLLVREPVFPLLGVVVATLGFAVGLGARRAVDAVGER